MTERWRAWLEETHSGNFELMRHFAGGFFDNEMLSIPGEWATVAAGIFAALVSIGLLVFTTFYSLFTEMDGRLSKDRIYTEIRGNEFVFIGLAGGIAAPSSASWRSCLSYLCWP